MFQYVVTIPSVDVRKRASLGDDGKLRVPKDSLYVRFPPCVQPVAAAHSSVATHSADKEVARRNRNWAFVRVTNFCRLACRLAVAGCGALCVFLVREIRSWSLLISAITFVIRSRIDAPGDVVPDSPSNPDAMSALRANPKPGTVFLYVPFGTRLGQRVLARSQTTICGSPSPRRSIHNP